jgi:Ribbon-helix-helix protein, copG family
MSSFRPLGEGKAIVQLVLPQAWVTRINALTIERGINRSALIRDAIAAVYFSDLAEGGGSHKQTPVVNQAS